MQQIGRRLRAAREHAGLTQQDVAERLDIKRATLANWEAGRHHPPLLVFRELLTLYAASPYGVLYGSRRFRLTEQESMELQRLARHCSAGLQMKISLALTVFAVEEGP